MTSVERLRAEAAVCQQPAIAGSTLPLNVTVIEHLQIVNPNFPYIGRRRQPSMGSPTPTLGEIRSARFTAVALRADCGSGYCLPL